MEGFGEAIGQGLLKIMEKELQRIAQEEAKKIYAQQQKESQKNGTILDRAVPQEEQQTLAKMTRPSTGSADDVFNHRRTAARTTPNRSSNKINPPLNGSR